MQDLVDRASAHNKFSACSHCAAKFRPQRRSARFCSPRCRLSAHRGLPARASEKPRDAFLSVSGAHGIHKSSSGARETLTRPSRSKLDPRIVSDARWSGMFRLRLPGGSLTDMVNLTRARDALASLEDAGQP
jgi:hypothetical protein